MDNENTESNKNVEEVSDIEEYKFNYNFTNIPWDDRSDRSKFGAVALLVAIFVVTTALVINNLVMHYRGFYSGSFNNEIDCNVVKLDDYPYVARIHLLSSNEIVCVGAVLSRYSVLANEVCLKSGPIRIRVGRPNDPRCKKGFSVDVVETIPHEGVIVTKNLVLLSIIENMDDCMKTIKIGTSLNEKKPLEIIGRSFHGGRVLSFQLAKYIRKNVTSSHIAHDFNKNKTIAVRTFGKCPVRAGDLLLQNDKLFGLASTSLHRREQIKTVYFANLTDVQQALRILDVAVGFNAQ